MFGDKQILIVDDDTTLLDMLSEQLELHEEFTSIGVGSGAEALEKAKQKYYDVIILDLGLPDMDGREVCKLMRRGGVRSPIIMLTGADADADTILGLEAGANDCVTKPFKLSVLMARIRAHIRQHERSDDAIFTIGPYTFQPANKMLVIAEENKKVRLTDKETEILKFLYRAGDCAVSREVLLDKVWGYNTNVTTHTLETHVYRLRQKLEPQPSNAQILVTEPGGYRLAP